MFKVESTPDWNREYEEGFLVYYYSMQKSWDIDPAYPAMNWLRKDEKLNNEQFIWMSFLYAQTYCVPTVYYILSVFPDFDDINDKKFQDWHRKNWKKLQYATDKRHEKGKLIDAYISYKNILNGTSQGRFIDNLMEYDDNILSYTNFEQVFKDVRGFGRLTLFMFVESLKRQDPNNYNLDCSAKNIIGSQSCCNGLCYVSNHKELIDNAPTESSYSNINKLREIIKEVFLGEIDTSLLDGFALETVLCAYKGLFTGRRYLGYYIDRFQYEILKMEVNTGFDFTKMWNLRSDVFLHGYLGELNGWKGIRKEKRKMWKEDNKLFDLEPLVKEGIIEFGDKKWKTRKNLSLSSF